MKFKIFVEYHQKKIIYTKHQYRFKDIKNLIIPKIELKKYIKIGKRTITYDNSKNMNYYFHINHILLNIRERKKAVRKINSQKIYKKKPKPKIYKNTETSTIAILTIEIPQAKI